MQATHILKYTSASLVGFKITVPVLEQWKAVNALDCTAVVTNIL